MPLTASATRGSTEVQKLWRKKQSKLFEAFNFMCEEISDLETVPKEDLAFSLRETLIMLDLNEGGRAASIPEGGYKSLPSSPNAEEGSISLQHHIVRFTITELSRWADQGQANQLDKQLSYQVKKAFQGLGRHLADYRHGSSSGVLATTDSDLTTSTSEQTLTLAAGYGNTAITDAAFITDKFREGTGTLGDRVAIFDGSTLKGMGHVTSRSTTSGTIGVTPDSAPTADSTNGLKIVKANSMEAATEAGTDFQRGMVGWQDALSAASLHGLTHANWVPGFTDATGGRLNGIRLRKAFQTIGNKAPAEYKVDRIDLDQGVHRDMIAYERPALRFDSAFAMEVDGDIKAKGKTINESRRMPPGWAYVYSSKAIGKVELIPMPDENGVGENDLATYPDRSLMVGELPYLVGLVYKCRSALGYFSGLTTQ